eukprot:6177559-Pleurochrysis_carterae.AAC.6
MHAESSAGVSFAASICAGLGGRTQRPSASGIDTVGASCRTRALTCARGRRVEGLIVARDRVREGRLLEKGIARLKCAEQCTGTVKRALLGETLQSFERRMPRPLQQACVQRVKRKGG